MIMISHCMNVYNTVVYSLPELVDKTPLGKSSEFQISCAVSALRFKPCNYVLILGLNFFAFCFASTITTCIGYVLYVKS
jgi:hypothetical protein